MDVYTVTGNVKISPEAPKQLDMPSRWAARSSIYRHLLLRAVPKTGNGPITFRGAGEDVTLVTVGGKITVSGPRLQAGATSRA